MAFQALYDRLPLSKSTFSREIDGLIVNGLFGSSTIRMPFDQEKHKFMAFVNRTNRELLFTESLHLAACWGTIAPYRSSGYLLLRGR